MKTLSNECKFQPARRGERGYTNATEGYRKRTTRAFPAMIWLLADM
jgi:hypothetical protein